MLYFTQATDHKALFQAFLYHYPEPDPFIEPIIIVPTKTIAKDLEHRLAEHFGVSWGLKDKFWAMFEWEIIEQISPKKQNFEFAPLGKVTMHWKIFSYLKRYSAQILENSDHPLCFFLKILSLNGERMEIRRLWQFSGEMARIFALYLNTRADWLRLWIKKKPQLKDFIKFYENLNLPHWLNEHYEALFNAQYFLFIELFKNDFIQRENDVQNFYQQIYSDLLPPKIYIYLLDGANYKQFQTLYEWQNYCDIYVFQIFTTNHYIADLKDGHYVEKKQFEALQENQFLNDDLDNLHLDFGHYLYSRFCKNQRDMARLLNYFQIEPTALNYQPERENNLFNALKTDMENLNGEALLKVPNNPDDKSLRVFACHGLLRQLEVLRSELVTWLNADKSRQLSDILLVFPDLSAHLASIQAIFPKHGIYDGYHLPARITGVASDEAENLWQSISGFYTLLDGRFDLRSLATWLFMPETHQALGLSYEEMQKAVNYLEKAGFRRGFDENHLKSTLHPDDTDYRFTFCSALDQLCRDLLDKEALPFQDRHLINVLCELALIFRDNQQKKQENTPISVYLADLQALLNQRYGFASRYDGFSNLNKILRDLKYSFDKPSNFSEEEQSALPVQFILDYVAQDLAMKQTGGEPSGAITIGDIRAMKQVPFKLIAFVQANSDIFPKIQRDNRYNLCDLDQKRIGDRNSEQEDASAFLDLFTSAQETLWFFYTHIDPQDHEERLPAKPVAEVLHFLRQEVPHLEALFYQETGQSPFNAQENTPLWRNIAQNLAKNEIRQEFIKLDLNQKPSLKPLVGENFELNAVIRDLQKPASAYLRHLNIRLPSEESALPTQEPLHLNGLGQYQLFDHLIQGGDWEEAPFPAGAAGRVWGEYYREQLAPKMQDFFQSFGQKGLTPTSAQNIQLTDQTLLIAHLPNAETPHWLNLSVSRASYKHQLRLWLKHLAWCGSASGGGETWQAFKEKKIGFKPIPQMEARHELMRYLQWVQNIRQNLFFIPMELILKCKEAKEDEKNIKEWLKGLEPQSHFMPISPSEDYRAWDYLIQNQKVENILKENIEQYRDFNHLFYEYLLD